MSTIGFQKRAAFQKNGACYKIKTGGALCRLKEKKKCRFCVRETLQIRFSAKDGVAWYNKTDTAGTAFAGHDRQSMISY